MSQMREFITISTNSTITCDDKSLYRALRRFYDADMVEYSTLSNTKGPDIKLYSLTGIGKKVLQAFIDQNIIAIFDSPIIRKLFDKS